MGRTTVLQEEDISHLFHKVMDRYPSKKEIDSVASYIGGHFTAMANLTQDYIREMSAKGHFRVGDLETT